MNSLHNSLHISAFGVFNQPVPDVLSTLVGNAATWVKDKVVSEPPAAEEQVVQELTSVIVETPESQNGTTQASTTQVSLTQDSPTTVQVEDANAALALNLASSHSVLLEQSLKEPKAAVLIQEPIESATVQPAIVLLEQKPNESIQASKPPAYHQPSPPPYHQASKILGSKILESKKLEVQKEESKRADRLDKPKVDEKKEESSVFSVDPSQHTSKSHKKGRSHKHHHHHHHRSSKK